MTFTCLSVIRQGWLGLPLFLVGIVSLAFSQLAQTEDNVTSSAEELVSSLTSDLNAQSERMSKLEGLLEENPLSSFRGTVLSNLEAASNQGTNSDVEVERLKSNLNGVEDAWVARKGELTNSIQNTNKRLLESKAILNDLKDEFAGRLGEAQIPLQVLKETALKTENESIALEKLMDAARKDAIFGIQSLVKESEQLNARTLPTPPAESPKAPNTITGRNVSAVIRSSEAVPLSSSDRFSPSIVAAPNILTNLLLLLIEMEIVKLIGLNLNLLHQRTFKLNYLRILLKCKSSFVRLTEILFLCDQTLRNPSRWCLNCKKQKMHSAPIIWVHREFLPSRLLTR